MCSFSCLILTKKMYVGQTDAQIQAATEQMWSADANRFSNSDMQYNTAGPK